MITWKLLWIVASAGLAIWLASVLWRMFAPTGSGSLVSDPEERRLKRPIEVWVAALLIVAVMGALAFFAFDQSAALLVDLGSLS